MSAYVVALINVTDPERYKEYTVLATPAVTKYGGKFIARGGEREVMEGSLDYARVVVVEFPSMDAVKTFYKSPEYQAARAKRVGAADFNMIITSGA